MELSRLQGGSVGGVGPQCFALTCHLGKKSSKLNDSPSLNSDGD